MFKSFLAALAIVWASFFGGHSSTASYQPAAVAVAAPTNQTSPISAAGTSAPVPSALPAPQLFPTAAPASQQPSNISAPEDANTAAAGQVLGTSTQASYVTQEELTAQLQQVANALRSVIYQNDSAPNSLPASGGYTNNIAMSNAIDQLSGTMLNNVTVNGVSGLTAAEIPTDIVAANYLPLSGGTLTGSLFVTTVSASSTIFGGFTATNATTTNATSTNAFATNLTAGSAAFTNATTSAFAVTGTSYFAGNVGIGTTSPAYPLDVNGSIRLTGGLNMGTSTSALPGQINLDDSGVVTIGTAQNLSGAAFINARVLTGTSNAHGFDDTSVFERTGGAAYASFNAQANFVGTNNYTHYVAFQADGQFSTTGTITNYIGLSFLPVMTNGTLINSYGAYISDGELSGGAAIGTQYGIFVQNLAAGSNNYAIYAAGSTPSYFGGATTFASPVNSSSPSTGGVIVSGGLGVLYNLNVGQNVSSTGYHNTSGTTGGYEIDNALILQASSSLSSIFVGQGSGNSSYTVTQNAGLGPQCLSDELLNHMNHL
jgi:hypothetical protein